MRVLCVAAILCASVCALAQKQQGAGPASAKVAAAAPSPDHRIDVNHASIDDLMTVPGLGRVWAVRVVRYRPYRTKEDLLDRGVVSGAVFDRISNFVIAHRDKK